MKFPIITLIVFAQMIASGMAYADPADETVATTTLLARSDAYPLEAEAPEFPVELLKRKMEGRTLLMLRVTEQGDVADVKVVASTHKLFSEAAIRSVKKWYFQPGFRDGQAVSQIVAVPLEFVIEGLERPSLTAI